MADSILRLKIDSQEYDAKIKRAAEGIQAYAEGCRRAGGTLEHLDEGVLEFVQALGRMDTSAKTTKGQLREMTQSLADLTTTYRSLTDEEKRSPFGQALAASIQQLTERAGTAKDAMMDVEMSIKNAASDTRMFDQMAQGMSVATAGFQGLTGAGKLLGIQMGNDVEVIAKLQAALAVTNSLTTIQNALQKQSAFMQGLNAAKTALATAAQQAYAVATGEATVAQAAFNIVADANPYGLMLAAIGAVIGTITTFSVLVGDTTAQSEDMANAMDRVAESIKRTQDAFDKLANSMKEEGFGGQEQYSALYNANVKRIRELKQLGMDAKDPEDKKRYLDEIQKLQEANRKLKEENNARRARLMKLLRGDFSDLDTEAKVDSAISFLKNQMKYVQQEGTTYRAIQGRISELETFWKSPAPRTGTTTTSGSQTPKAVKMERDEFQEMDELIGLLNIQKQKIADIEAMKPFAETEDAIARINKQLEVENNEYQRLLNLGKNIKQEFATGLSGVTQDTLSWLIGERQTALKSQEYGTAGYAKASASLADVQAFQNILSEAAGKGAAIDTSASESILDALLAGDNVRPMLESFIETINASLADGVEPIKIDFETGNITRQAKEMQKDWAAAGQAIQQVGAAMTQIEDPATKVVGTVAQAIATIALSYAEAMKTAAAAGPWAWIGFAATGLATMLSTIGTIHAATGYSEGGMVKGTSYSGDNLLFSGGTIGLNAGEIVLTKAMQSNLASQYDGGGLQNLHLETYIDGRNLRIVLNNDSQSRGRGKMVTSTNYRG